MILAFASSLLASTGLPPLARSEEPIDGRLHAVARIGAAWWYGTPRGVYVRPDEAPSGYLAGLEDEIASIAASPDGVLVCGPTGAWRIGTVVTPLPLPAGWNGSGYGSAAFTNESVPGRDAGRWTGWLAGAGGLVRIEADAMRMISLPVEGQEIAAIAAMGSDLLVACSDGVRLFAPVRGSWKMVAPGIHCEQLVAGPSGAWFGVTSSGDLLGGSVEPSAASDEHGATLRNGLRSIELGGQAVSAIAPGFPGSGEILAGTFHGAVGVVGWGEDRLRYLIEGPQGAAAPITGLAVEGAEAVRAATAGGGPRDFLADGSRLREIAPDLRVARMQSMPVGAPAARAGAGGWRARLGSLLESTRTLRFVQGRGIPAGTWALASGALVAVVVLIVLAAVVHRARGAAGRDRGERRGPGAPGANSIAAPMILELLSPDVAEHARRFRDLTIRIDNLSREAARGPVPTAREEARRALEELASVEAWMRERLNALRPELASDRVALEAMPGDDEGADGAQEALGREKLAERIAAAERDMAYLLYILED